MFEYKSTLYDILFTFFSNQTNNLIFATNLNYILPLIIY